MEKLTADLTDSAKGPVRNTVQESKTDKLQFCQRVNKEKHFTDSQFKGGVNVFKLFYQFNPDFKVWLAQTQKLQCGHPKGAVVPEKLDSTCLLEMPHGQTPWLLHSLSVFRFHTPGIFVNCPLMFAVLAAIDSDVGRQEEGRQILEVCSWPLPRYSGQSLRLSSPLQRHTPLP